MSDGPKSFEEFVTETMSDTWNDICDDTGCHPLDIKQHGRKVISFSPNHWATYIAGRVASEHAATIRTLQEQVKKARESQADDLRAIGLTVAVHNDYRLNGEAHTFWLMTDKTGMSYKGEGKTDAEALNQIRALKANGSPLVVTRSVEAIQSDLSQVLEAISFCQEHSLIVKHESRAEELRKELKEAKAAKSEQRT